ncbi:MAG: ATP-binding cassette domain-containing protein [Euryarchaeota archaeon]|nr:ATP-binding cassette domain-containing protein [Euryarchaeota archaeon]
MISEITIDPETIKPKNTFDLSFLTSNNGTWTASTVQATAALDDLPFAPVGADHHPWEMSGGEQQRVAIARALINKPKILFADEPTANLDSVSPRQILELFRKLFLDMGQTILMVTHEERYQGITNLRSSAFICGSLCFQLT